jgi:putative flippase GtrA
MPAEVIVETPVEPATLAGRILRFAKSLLVGGVATLADFAALTALIELAHLHETVANVPALCVGALVQFIGCRHLVFQAARGHLGKQLLGFAVVELATLALNGVAFHLLVTQAGAPYWLARPLGTFAVFVGFSYPLWKWVFRSSLKQALAVK